MANTYTLLETITVGAAGASSVTFNSIPQTGYTDLKVVCSVRSTRVNPSDGMNLEFNADNANNYSTRRIYGVGSGTPTSDSLTPYARIFLNDIPASTATASTFCNSEFYVPNYRSSNQKSVSADTAFENNTTAAGLVLLAGLWTGTAAISSIRLYPDGGNFTQHSTFSLYGVSALGVTPTKAPKATGGSIIQTDGTYWYHAFLSSGTFTPATALTCDVLVVAGGGGGGFTTNSRGGGGGGGAGGLLYFASQSIGTSAQTVTVGGGGPGATSLTAVSGSNSSFAALTAAVGGGGGACTFTGSGALTGGSGGGGEGDSFTTGANGTAGQGNKGGNGASGGGSGTTAGGGGGAGAVGTNATSTVPGAGGIGINTYSSWLSTTGLGVSGYVAGGGGGGGSGQDAGTYSGGAGGTGGGGAGGSVAVGTAGTANTGGGGGGAGARFNLGSQNGGAGGSGIVIIRYLAA